MGAFDATQFEHFDPFAVEGFDATHFENFDPLAMGAFDATQFEHFDPFAMEGFDASHLENFDPEAVSGFGRDHLTGMDPDALTGFEFEHVFNLDEEAKEGFGDHVMDFGDFDLEVRGELIGEEAQRMGGFGSFDDLLAQIGGEGPTPEELKALGWDEDFDPTALDFGLDGVDVDDLFDDDTLANAFAAFGG